MRDRVLWNRLISIDLDGGGEGGTLARRIAEVARWPKHVAARLVPEFRRLIYLMLISPNPIPVPQPLALAVQEYQTDRVEGASLRPVGPNSGFVMPGSVSDFRYWVLLYRLRRHYQAEFKSPPPSDIWSGSAVDHSLFLGGSIALGIVLTLTGGMLAFVDVGDFGENIFVERLGAVMLVSGLLLPFLVVDLDYLVWKYVYKSGKKGGHDRDPKDR